MFRARTISRNCLSTTRSRPSCAAAALRMLDPTNPLLAGDKPKEWLAAHDPALRWKPSAACARPRAMTAWLLLAIASRATRHWTNASGPKRLSGFPPADAGGRELLLKLAAGSNAALRREALRFRCEAQNWTPAEQKILSESSRADPRHLRSWLTCSSRPFRCCLAEPASGDRTNARSRRSILADTARRSSRRGAGERIFFIRRDRSAIAVTRLMGVAVVWDPI